MISLRDANQLLDVEDIINTSHLTRWHMIKVDREQTLAEHLHLVAMLSTKILYDCADLNNPSLTSISRMVLEEALLHDYHELSHGDMPANPVARARVKEMTGGLNLSRLIQEDYWRGKADRKNVDQPEETIDSIAKFVKIADCFEAMTFYCLNGDPRTYNLMAIANGTITAVVKAVKEINAADESFLGLRPDSLKKWVTDQMIRWAPRFNSNFGTGFCSTVESQVREAFSQ